jgi:hypothetical protein
VNVNSLLFLRKLVNSRSSRRETVEFTAFSESEFKNLRGEVRGREDKWYIVQSGRESRKFGEKSVSCLHDFVLHVSCKYR